MESLIQNKNIQYLVVKHRVKDLKGFLNKIRLQKGKKNPYKTDLAGLRVVCYLTSDIEQIMNLVKENFNVLKIEDKSKHLGVNKMGYQALHIDVALSKSRALLPEYVKFKRFMFEVQICTSLRHTWNEIEHKRKYKAGTDLPDDLNRDINELSVIIDRTDEDLNNYSNAVDKMIKSSITDQELKRPLYSSDLGRFLSRSFKGVPGFEPSFGERGSKNVIKEMKWMGLKTISDFKKIMPPNIKRTYRKVSRPEDLLTYTLIVREILIMSNPNQYFEEVWKQEHFAALDNHAYRVFKELKVNVNLPTGMEWED
jgi:ppGpp synthetase/RelA/SpoT-type nucleotidyltranferase